MSVTTTNEQQVRQVMEAWTAAVARKNLDALMKDYSDQVRVFDVGSQLEGREAYRQLWEMCFPYFEETIGIERRDTRVVAGDDVAVITFYSRLSGMKDASGPMARSWFRCTVCYQKVDGEWKSFHEHVSLPVDCMAEKPSYILDEEDKAVFANA